MVYLKSLISQIKEEELRLQSKSRSWSTLMNTMTKNLKRLLRRQILRDQAEWALLWYHLKMQTMQKTNLEVTQRR